MQKVDVRVTQKELYRPPSQKITEVDVPAMQFLAIDGHGDPNGEDFGRAVEALYSLAYTIKFWPKKHDKPEGYYDFAVSPLEGLWWMEGRQDWSNPSRDQWQWTAMIRQPEFVTQALLDEARLEVVQKKPNYFLAGVSLHHFQEGVAAQIMHIGPFANEAPTIQKLHEYIAARGGELSGRHHEIYLSDPRRGNPATMKTVLRQPFTTAPA